MLFLGTGSFLNAGSFILENELKGVRVSPAPGMRPRVINLTANKWIFGTPVKPLAIKILTSDSSIVLFELTDLANQENGLYEGHGTSSNGLPVSIEYTLETTPCLLEDSSECFLEGDKLDTIFIELHSVSLDGVLLENEFKGEL